jgi:hypothetical protein
MRKPLDVRAPETKEMHALVELVGGMRPARSQFPELRPAHAEVTGDPLQLALIHRVQLGATAPPPPQPRQA